MNSKKTLQRTAESQHMPFASYMERDEEWLNPHAQQTSIRFYSRDEEEAERKIEEDNKTLQQALEEYPHPSTQDYTSSTPQNTHDAQYDTSLLLAMGLVPGNPAYDSYVEDQLSIMPKSSATTTFTHDDKTQAIDASRTDQWYSMLDSEDSEDRFYSIPFEFTRMPQAKPSKSPSTSTRHAARPQHTGFGMTEQRRYDGMSDDDETTTLTAENANYHSLASASTRHAARPQHTGSGMTEQRRYDGMSDDDETTTLTAGMASDLNAGTASIATHTNSDMHDLGDSEQEPVSLLYAAKGIEPLCTDGVEGYTRDVINLEVTYNNCPYPLYDKLRTRIFSNHSLRQICSQTSYTYNQIVVAAIKKTMYEKQQATSQQATQIVLTDADLPEMAQRCEDIVVQDYTSELNINRDPLQKVIKKLEALMMYEGEITEVLAEAKFTAHEIALAAIQKTIREQISQQAEQPAFTNTDIPRAIKHCKDIANAWYNAHYNKQFGQKEAEADKTQSTEPNVWRSSYPYNALSDTQRTQPAYQAYGAMYLAPMPSATTAANSDDAQRTPPANGEYSPEDLKSILNKDTTENSETILNIQVDYKALPNVDKSTLINHIYIFYQKRLNILNEFSKLDITIPKLILAAIKCCLAKRTKHEDLHNTDVMAYVEELTSKLESQMKKAQAAHNANSQQHATAKQSTALTQSSQLSDNLQPSASAATAAPAAATAPTQSTITQTTQTKIAPQTGYANTKSTKIDSQDSTSRKAAPQELDSIDVRELVETRAMMAATYADNPDAQEAMARMMQWRAMIKAERKAGMHEVVQRELTKVKSEAQETKISETAQNIVTEISSSATAHKPATAQGGLTKMKSSATAQGGSYWATISDETLKAERDVDEAKSQLLHVKQHDEQTAKQAKERPELAKARTDELHEQQIQTHIQAHKKEMARQLEMKKHYDAMKAKKKETENKKPAKMEEKQQAPITERAQNLPSDMANTKPKEAPIANIATHQKGTREHNLKRLQALTDNMETSVNEVVAENKRLLSLGELSKESKPSAPAASTAPTQSTASSTASQAATARIAPSSFGSPNSNKSSISAVAPLQATATTAKKTTMPITLAVPSSMAPITPITPQHSKTIDTATQNNFAILILSVLKNTREGESLVRRFGDSAEKLAQKVLEHYADEGLRIEDIPTESVRTLITNINIAVVRYVLSKVLDCPEGKELTEIYKKSVENSHTASANYKGPDRIKKLLYDDIGRMAVTDYQYLDSTSGPENAVFIMDFLGERTLFCVAEKFVLNQAKTNAPDMKYRGRLVKDISDFEATHQAVGMSLQATERLDKKYIELLANSLTSANRQQLKELNMTGEWFIQNYLLCSLTPLQKLSLTDREIKGILASTLEDLYNKNFYDHDNPNAKEKLQSWLKQAIGTQNSNDDRYAILSSLTDSITEKATEAEKESCAKYLSELITEHAPSWLQAQRYSAAYPMPMSLLELSIHKRLGDRLSKAILDSQKQLYKTCADCAQPDAFHIRRTSQSIIWSLGDLARAINRAGAISDASFNNFSATINSLSESLKLISISINAKNCTLIAERLSAVKEAFSTLPLKNNTQQFKLIIDDLSKIIVALQSQGNSQYYIVIDDKLYKMIVLLNDCIHKMESIIRPMIGITPTAMHVATIPSAAVVPASIVWPTTVGGITSTAHVATIPSAAVVPASKITNAPNLPQTPAISPLAVKTSTPQTKQTTMLRYILQEHPECKMLFRNFGQNAETLERNIRNYIQREHNLTAAELDNLHIITATPDSATMADINYVLSICRDFRMQASLEKICDSDSGQELIRIRAAIDAAINKKTTPPSETDYSKAKESLMYEVADDILMSHKLNTAKPADYYNFDNFNERYLLKCMEFFVLSKLPEGLDLQNFKYRGKKISKITLPTNKKTGRIDHEKVEEMKIDSIKSELETMLVTTLPTYISEKLDQTTISAIAKNFVWQMLRKDQIKRCTAVMLQYVFNGVVANYIEKKVYAAKDFQNQEILGKLRTSALEWMHRRAKNSIIKTDPHSNDIALRIKNLGISQTALQQLIERAFDRAKVEAAKGLEIPFFMFYLFLEYEVCEAEKLLIANEYNERKKKDLSATQANLQTWQVPLKSQTTQTKTTKINFNDVIDAKLHNQGAGEQFYEHEGEGSYEAWRAKNIGEQLCNVWVARYLLLKPPSNKQAPNDVDKDAAFQTIADHLAAGIDIEQWLDQIEQDQSSNPQQLLAKKEAADRIEYKRKLFRQLRYSRNKPALKMLGHIYKMELNQLLKKPFPKNELGQISFETLLSSDFKKADKDAMANEILRVQPREINVKAFSILENATQFMKKWFPEINISFIDAIIDQCNAEQLYRVEAQRLQAVFIASLKEHNSWCKATKNFTTKTAPSRQEMKERMELWLAGGKKCPSKLDLSENALYISAEERHTMIENVLKAVEQSDSGNMHEILRHNIVLSCYLKLENELHILLQQKNQSTAVPSTWQSHLPLAVVMPTTQPAALTNAYTTDESGHWSAEFTTDDEERLSSLSTNEDELDYDSTEFTTEDEALDYDSTELTTDDQEKLSSLRMTDGDILLPALQKETKKQAVRLFGQDGLNTLVEYFVSNGADYYINIERLKGLFVDFVLKEIELHNNRNKTPKTQNESLKEVEEIFLSWMDTTQVKDHTFTKAKPENNTLTKAQWQVFANVAIDKLNIQDWACRNPHIYYFWLERQSAIATNFTTMNDSPAELRRLKIHLQHNFEKAPFIKPYASPQNNKHADLTVATGGSAGAKTTSQPTPPLALANFGPGAANADLPATQYTASQQYNKHADLTVAIGSSAGTKTTTQKSIFQTLQPLKTADVGAGLSPLYGFDPADAPKLAATQPSFGVYCGSTMATTQSQEKKQNGKKIAL